MLYFTSSVLTKTDIMKQRDGEGALGYKVTEKRKKEISLKFSGKNHPLFGKRHTIETREKQSKAKQGKYNGSNNPNYGKVAWNRGKAICAQTREKVSRGHRQSAFYM